MAEVPALTDDVRLNITRFGRFKQSRREQQGAKLGRPFTYQEEAFIIFFIFMQFRQIHAFKAQWRWLKKHPEMLEMLGWATVPDRTTLSRRYKALDAVVQDFVLFIGQYAPELDEQFSQAHLVEDKSNTRRWVRSGTSPTAKRDGFQRNCASRIRMPPGPRAPIMAGSTATACT